MARRSHLTRKELKEDAFQEAGRSVIEYISDHRHKILTGVLALVALILLSVAARNFTRRGIERANADLFAFQSEYNQALSIADTQTRNQILDAVIDSSAAFHQKYSAKPVGREALLVQANSQFIKGDYPAALETFKRHIAEASTDEEKARGHLGVGDTLAKQAFYDNENRDLLEQAKAAYETAEKTGLLPNGKPSYLSCEAAMGKARAMLMLGELADAQAIYERIKRERPFHEEPARELSMEDIVNWQNLSRSEKTRLVRQDILARKTFSSFQARAERRLKEMDRRIAVAQEKTAP